MKKTSADEIEKSISYQYVEGRMLTYPFSTGMLTFIMK